MSALTQIKNSIGILENYSDSNIPQIIEADKIHPEKKDYTAFLLLILFIVSSSIIYYTISGYEELTAWIRGFMGVFFFIFGFIKVMDINGFIVSFREYNILAKIYPDYAKLYPFLEIGIGLALLFDFLTSVMSIVAFILTSIGAAGIIKEHQMGNKIKCTHMASRIKLPLSTVSLSEDILMAVMAIFIILF